ncbi:hypothetical protein ANASTE_01907 [Anaerofustis stercorihominis DSM 17244]|uniref:Uncharacterized protein n=1 Tax=Anaerofustis stercorihominis DSM 17244 TaxID=445971 RepID=B1C9Y2_9FIRM|nr:hypothetical protein ANASTE_01907 [Anaerofustis stercorihominis DSM 17244]
MLILPSLLIPLSPITIADIILSTANNIFTNAKLPAFVCSAFASGVSLSFIVVASPAFAPLANGV